CAPVSTPVRAQINTRLRKVFKQPPSSQSLVMVPIGLSHGPHDISSRDHELLAAQTILLLGQMDDGLPGLEMLLVQMWPAVLDVDAKGAVLNSNLSAVGPFTFLRDAEKVASDHRQRHADLDHRDSCGICFFGVRS